MIRTERIKHQIKEHGPANDTAAAAAEETGAGSSRVSAYSLLSRIVQQGWKVEHLDRQGAVLSKADRWRQRLFIAGFLLLPLMGFGLILWILALFDAISGAKQYLQLSFEAIQQGGKPAHGRLNTRQHFSLAGFGLVFALWLLAALPALLPGTFNVIIPLPESLHFTGGSGSQVKMGAVIPMVGMPYTADAEPTPTSSPMPALLEDTPTPTMTPLLPMAQTFTPTTTATPTQTATPRPDPSHWKNWPVLPKFSQNWVEIYEKGIENGNNPQAFSVVGDCQSVPYLFMGMYDGSWYTKDNLAESLQETIDFFSGSFSRYDMTILDGATAASILATGWANRSWCDINESPLDCELRLHKPSFVIINIGTHWTARNKQYLRTIVETIIDTGALPILTTKGDNLEGDHSVNLQIAEIASEYDIPLWNLWREIQDLPGHGLDPYRQGGYMYYTSSGLEARRLSGLKLLDRIRQAVD